MKPFLGDDASIPGTVSNEKAEPGYYAVTMTNLGVRAEMTATRRVAIYRFTFEHDGMAHVLVDTQSGPTAGWRPERPAMRVTKSRSSFGYDGVFTAANSVWCWIDGRRVACALRFNREPSAFRALSPNGKPGKRWVFDFRLSPGDRSVSAACAISSVDEQGARRNLATCESPFDFDARRADALRAWNDILSKAEIDSTPRERKMFYTALYHAWYQPNLFSDTDGRCRQENIAVVTAGKGHEIYTTFSTWDTFRAVHPLYTILQPSIVPDLVASLAAQIDGDGYLPIWQTFGREAGCMPGDHSVAILEEARAKGLFGDTDMRKVFQAMERSLHRRRGEFYDKLGYYPYDDTSYELLPTKPYMPVSRQLENVYDDYCAAKFAVASGHEEQAVHYRRRAKYWRNIFDPSTKMFRGRSFAGDFRKEPLDAYKQGPTPAEKEAGTVFDYTEGSAAHWAWHVLHAPKELVALHGGAEQTTKDLDALFTAPETIVGQVRRSDCSGQIGQYAHGNEPCHHVAFAYLYAGRPDRTADVVREIVRKHYGDDEHGLCGNDDCGQMSAWYVFACLGLYPYDPASATYVVGVPQAKRVTLRLENGQTFTTRVENMSDENRYIANVRLDGYPLSDFIIRHEDVMRGGELVFTMCSKPVNWYAR